MSNMKNERDNFLGQLHSRVSLLDSLISEMEWEYAHHSPSSNRAKVLIDTLDFTEQARFQLRMAIDTIKRLK